MTNVIYRKDRVIQTFCHNFADDIGTDLIFLPWSDSTETTTAGSKSAFCSPYPMRCLKVYLRVEDPSTTHTLTFKLETQDSGDDNSTKTTIATVSQIFTMPTDDYTGKSLTTSDFSADPYVEENKNVILGIESDTDPGTSQDWFITTVWEMFI
jgi:hypothetical protein